MPWLKLSGLVLLCGCHCSILPAGEAAAAEVTVMGSEDNASFEVPASGSPRLIRAEQSESREEEDLQTGPVQEAALVWMNETSSAEYEYCGGPQYISTCGFKDTKAISFQGREIRGLCVCSGALGCKDPVCTSDMNYCRTNNRPFCADGHSCVELGGHGWQCWHPCDLAKRASEYGTYSSMVTQIRTSQCGSNISSRFSSARAADPHQRHPVASSQGGQPYSQGSSTQSQLGSVSSSSSNIQTWGRNPPLNAGLYLAYNNHPFGGQIVIGGSTQGVSLLCVMWSLVWWFGTDIL